MHVKPTWGSIRPWMYTSLDTASVIIGISLILCNQASVEQTVDGKKADLKSDNKGKHLTNSTLRQQCSIQHAEVFLICASEES